MELDDALPLSGLQHLAFCPRQWALIHLEQAWAENRLTAEGRLLHERADLPGQSRRANMRTVRGMLLHNQRLRLTGRADIVESRKSAFRNRPRDRQLALLLSRYGVETARRTRRRKTVVRSARPTHSLEQACQGDRANPKHTHRS